MESEIHSTTRTISTGEEEKLRNTNSEVKTRCRQLEKKCRALEDETDRLKQKLQKMNEEVLDWYSGVRHSSTKQAAGSIFTKILTLKFGLKLTRKKLIFTPQGCGVLFHPWHLDGQADGQ